MLLYAVTFIEGDNLVDCPEGIKLIAYKQCMRIVIIDHGQILLSTFSFVHTTFNKNIRVHITRKLKGPRWLKVPDDRSFNIKPVC